MSFSFTKLFSSITESTVWAEDDHTRLVWITMLAMADRGGRVWASIPGLANRARVPIASVEVALGKFKSQDPYSRTKDMDGRRIEDIDGGWKLLNYAKYRSIKDQESVRESKRNYIRNRRARERGESVENVSTVEPGRDKQKQKQKQKQSTPYSPPQAGDAVEVKPEPSFDDRKAIVGSWFNRRLTTPWSEKEEKLLRATALLASEDDMLLMGQFYTAKIPAETDYRRHDVFTLLNNWPGELDRARAWKANPNGARSRGQASISDLKVVMQIKDNKAKQLRFEHCNESSLGDEWTDSKAREEYVALRKEIRALQERIENMV